MRLLIFLFVCSSFRLFPAQAVEASVPLPVFKKEQHIDHQKQHIDHQEIEVFNQWQRNHVVEYFLDIVFENSFCRCRGNNGCTRGCKLAVSLNGVRYPPVRKCAGNKSMHDSLAKCARHVTGAIMSVTHDFLADHCRNTGQGTMENRMDYQQCIDNFDEDVYNDNTHICRHSFKFPSALCMLNLDGQNPRIYNKIQNKNVRSVCKNWDRYNQSLSVANVLLYDEEFVSIPLFNRLSPERNIEFQKAPHKIPIGAIIITQSQLKHGHIEVKTDRVECGKNKDQICFCSDHCRERARYYHPVLAVFEWNPDFIRFVNMNDISRTTFTKK